MLRLTELKLPLHHTEDELSAAIVETLGIKNDELLSFSILSVVMMHGKNQISC